MTTPSANPLRAACVPAVLQKCFFSCETTTLPVPAVRGTFCEGFPTFSKCVSLPPPHSLSASLLPFSLSSLKPHVHVTSTHPQRAPLRVHLTPETSEPWDGQMVDAGWELMHVHIFCAPPPSVRVSSVKVEHRKREIKHYALYCKCRSILITEMGLASWISRVLYDAVFQCRPRISEPRDVPRRCYQQC